MACKLLDETTNYNNIQRDAISRQNDFNEIEENLPSGGAIIINPVTRQASIEYIYLIKFSAMLLWYLTLVSI